MSTTKILSQSPSARRWRAKEVLVRCTGALMVLLLVTGCMTNAGQKQTAGTIIGAGVGGLAGSQIGKGSGQLAAVGTGALIGALIGAETGASLDRADQAYIDNAQQQAHSRPLGEQISWDNPQSGNSGTVVATRQGTTQTSGKLCREYHHTVWVGDDPEHAYGVACREEDGSWTIVN